MASEDEWMPVWDHIGELRKRVLRIAIVFALGMIGGLFGAQPLFDYLIAAAPDGRVSLHVFSPWDAISLYMKFAFVISLTLALPYAMFQLWQSVRPALGKNEQRATLGYVPWAFVLFLAGLTFAYFVVFPLAYAFTEQVAEGLGLEQTYGVTQYFSFLFNLLLPIALLFELPLTVLFLTHIGLLQPSLLQKMRRVAWFALIVVGTMVTPPDVVSDLLVAVPLVALYEFSVWMSQIAYRKRLAARNAVETTGDNAGFDEQ